MKNCCKPEGYLSQSSENREILSSKEGLDRAAARGTILESTATLCDGDMRLHVDLFGRRGIIERREAAFEPSGAPVKDIAIITRVGKPICFKVLGADADQNGSYYRLSRRDAQIECYRNYISDLIPGDIIDAVVTHLEPFGAFLDIGCGLPALLPIDSISISRISHPRDRLSPGMPIRCVVKSIDLENHRVFVSMRELLGSWEENAALFEPGQTVAGVVRSVEPYGIFIELTPNLAGLAEPADDLMTSPKPGQRAAVYIKSIIPDKMKIKLVIVDCFEGESAPKEPTYFTDGQVLHIPYWRYSPPGAPKVIETVFDQPATQDMP